jgi:hypothetical protein
MAEQPKPQRDGVSPWVRPSTWFAGAFAFVVALAGVWLAGTLLLPDVDTEISTLAGVLVGAFFAVRLIRRIT